MLEIKGIKSPLKKRETQNYKTLIMIIYLKWSQHKMKKCNDSQMVIVTRPSWLPCSKLLKTFKYHFIQNHWAYCLETWYEESLTVLLQRLFITWLSVDLDLFYGKFNSSSLGIEWEKLKSYFLLLLYSWIWKWSYLHHIWILVVKVI